MARGLNPWNLSLHWQPPLRIANLFHTTQPEKELCVVDMQLIDVLNAVLVIPLRLDIAINVEAGCSAGNRSVLESSALRGR